MKELLKDTFVTMIILMALVVAAFSLQNLAFFSAPAIAIPNPTATAIPSSTPTIEDLFDIPPRYYHHDPIIPAGVSLETWLSQQEWTVEYKENDFDCSKMVAYIEWALENSGYTAKIVLGEVYDDGEKYYHAWVEVRQNGKWRIIETTLLKFAPDAGIYYPLYEYDDIYELAMQLYAFDKRDFRLEFAWWPKK